jgi:type IV pilus assembly protein PilC
MVLVAMMVILTGVMLVVVIPQFQGFFEGLGGELPIPTQVLMGIASVLRENAALILTGLGIGAFLFWYWLRKESSALKLDQAFLRVPYFGGLVRMYATSQLMRTLSTLLGGGLPLVNSLETSAASIGNRAMARAVGGSTRLIREGASLTTALESTRMFETLPLEMVKVGEQTGALADMLSAVADFYDEEMSGRVAAVMALAEPVVLVLMAIMVAAMLLAFYMPLFEAISSIQR